MAPQTFSHCKQVLEGHTSDVTWCDFSGKNLVTCSNDKTVRLWVNVEGKFEESNVSPLDGHKYGVNCARFSPFGTVVASCSTDGTALVWNAQTGEQVAKLEHQSGSAIRVCCFSPSSALLVTGGDDETLVIWDLGTRSVIRSLEGHEAMITACAFTPDSTFIVSASTAGDLKLWDARYGHGKCLLTHPEAHDLGVLGCDFSPQYEVNAGAGPLASHYIYASCGNDDLVKVWHVRTSSHCSITLFHSLIGHTGNVWCCRFSNDGSLLASAGGDRLVILWDPGSGEMLQKLEGHSRYVTCCAFSSDNEFLASGSNDKTIIIWNITDHGTDGNGLDSDALRNSSNELSYTGQGVSSVAKWTVGDVGNWLEKIGLGQYCQVFEENQIDGQELLHLTHDTLLTSLKIYALGHRNKLLRGIQALRNPLWQHIALSEEDNVMPQELYCPITHELMHDPVVAADGYSYERSAITEWLNSGKDTSPMSNQSLEHTLLIPNHTLRLLIHKYTANC